MAAAMPPAPKEATWKEYFRDAPDDRFLDRYVLHKQYTNDNGSWFRLVTHEEAAKKEPRGVMWKHAATVSGAEVHMLGKKYQQGDSGGKEEDRSATVRCVGDVPTECATEDPELPGEVATYFRAMENIRTQLRELGWRHFADAKNLAFETAIATRPAELEAEMAKHEGSAAEKKEKAEAALRTQGPIHAAARALFDRNFHTWYFEGGKGMIGEPDKWPGEKLRVEWKVFTRNDKDRATNKPRPEPARPVDWTNATIFKPHDRFVDADPMKVFDIIESLRPLGYHPTPVYYYDRDGPIKWPMVVLPTGERVPKWAHPWFQMLTSGSFIEMTVSFKFYDTKKGYGVRINAIPQNGAQKVFMFHRAKLGQGAAPTSSSAAAKAVEYCDSDAEYQELPANKRPRDDEPAAADDESKRPRIAAPVEEERDDAFADAPMGAYE